MDENPAIRELDLAALIVRFAWIGTGLYVVCQLAAQINMYNLYQRVREASPGMGDGMFGAGATTVFSIFVNTVSALVYSLGLLVAAYATRTLIWIAVRHGAVPGQIMPNDEG